MILTTPSRGSLRKRAPHGGVSHKQEGLVKPAIVATIYLIFLTGCGTAIKLTNLNPSPKPISPKSPEQVQIFTTGRPAVPYTEVMLISSQQESEFSQDDTPEIIQKMREAAANQGCDALIITMSNDTVSGTTGGRSSGAYGHVDTMKGFHGTCVVYKN